MLYSKIVLTRVTTVARENLLLMVHVYYLKVVQSISYAQTFLGKEHAFTRSEFLVDYVYIRIKSLLAAPR